MKEIYYELLITLLQDRIKDLENKYDKVKKFENYKEAKYVEKSNNYFVGNKCIKSEKIKHYYNENDDNDFEFDFSTTAS